MKSMPQLCERARAWASLRADDELSELESALLEGHLDRCADCRSFADGADRLAAALRGADLVRPRPIAVRPLTRSDRRVGMLRMLQVTVAAVIVVGVGFVAAASSVPHGGARAAKPVAMVAGLDSPDRLRELRRPGLIERPRSLPRNRLVPGITV
jgi:hypothetical protein